jgi:transcriptional regulator NrdR family protein
MESDDPKLAAAQVSAARCSLELANAMPKKSVEITTMDDAVRQMTDKQKQQLIAEVAAKQVSDVLVQEPADIIDA